MYNGGISTLCSRACAERSQGASKREGTSHIYLVYAVGDANRPRQVVSRNDAQVLVNNVVEGVAEGKMLLGRKFIPSQVHFEAFFARASHHHPDWCEETRKNCAYTGTRVNSNFTQSQPFGGNGVPQIESPTR